jgi:hypothetical protein
VLKPECSKALFSLFIFFFVFFRLFLFFPFSFHLFRYDQDKGQQVVVKKEPKKSLKDKGKKDAETVAKEKEIEDNKKISSTNTVTMSGSHGSIISTAFTHMRTVSAFSMHHTISNQYELLTIEIAKRRISRSKMAGFGHGSANSMLFLSYGMLFWYGSTLINSGDITFLQLMTAILTLMLAFNGLGNAVSDLGDQKAGLKVAKHIFKDIDEGNQSPIDGLSVEGTQCFSVFVFSLVYSVCFCLFRAYFFFLFRRCYSTIKNERIN